MEYDVIVIGSGPGGYVAAIRAGQLGMKTALVERGRIGGMCLNWGCIPTKALLESAKRLRAVREAADFGVDGIDGSALAFNWGTALKRANRIVGRLTKGIGFLLKKNGVEWIEGTASIAGEKEVRVDNRLLKGEHIIIATGSRPGTIDGSIPAGILMEIDELLSAAAIPHQPVVVGRGPHAVELVQFFHVAGSEVTWLSPQGRLLEGVDPFLEDALMRLIKKAKIRTHAFSKPLEFKDGELILDDIHIPCDAVINASTRRGVLPESDVDLETEGGFLKVDDSLRTGRAGIYAVGDVNGRSTLAHAASAQALFAVGAIQGVKGKMDFSKIPFNMYTFPEMAQVGAGEPELEARGVDYRVSEFPLSANGKALAEGNSDGLIRILVEKKYGEVLGVQIVADHATDMIAEAAVVMGMEGTVFDVAATVHAHPTVSEIFLEAALDPPIHR